MVRGYRVLTLLPLKHEHIDGLEKGRQGRWRGGIALDDKLTIFIDTDTITETDLREGDDCPKFFSDEEDDDANGWDPA